jgi:hypothetical protein
VLGLTTGKEGLCAKAIRHKTSISTTVNEGSGSVACSNYVRPEKTLNSAADLPAGVRIPVPRSAIFRLYTGCWVGCVWDWWFPPLELHVHSSMWNEAEALSEYGVVPESFILCIHDNNDALPSVINNS